MNDRYQVSLFTCPATIPYSLGTHPWFVVLKNGKISRWEVLWRESQCSTSWGHLHLNFLPHEKGIETFPFSKKYHWSGKLISRVEGDENSLAKRMMDFIEKSEENYPFCYQYSVFGPNSNTYAEWVISHFRESNFKLPWNSFGRYYKAK